MHPTIQQDNKPIRSVHYNNNDIKIMVDILVSKIKESELKVDFILAVSCGGLIPAYYLAKKLGVRLVKSIPVSSYSGKKRNGMEIHELTDDWKNEIYNSENGLLVDDICDSGKTIKFVKKKLPKIHTATLIRRASTKIEVDYAAISLSEDHDNVRVEFPREF